MRIDGIVAPYEESWHYGKNQSGGGVKVGGKGNPRLYRIVWLISNTKK